MSAFLSSFRSVVPKARASVSRNVRAIHSVKDYPAAQITLLPNGVRVASESGHSKDIATVGIYVNAGSRYESKDTNGVAHFLEHMFFKGTNKRTQVALEKEIENIGGSLNAYTSREQTVFYASSFKKDVPQVLDILSDIILNSKISDEAIERERSTILREMEEVESQTEEVVFDRLHETAYRGTGLARTILGPVENIKKIDRKMIDDYISTHYLAPRIVVAGAGAIDHDDLVKNTEKLLGNVPSTPTNGIAPAFDPAVFTGSDIRVRYDSMKEAYIALAFPTAGYADPDTATLQVISTLLGSWDKSLTSGQYAPNRMVADIAKQELAHSVAPFHTPYSDTGLFGVFAVCPPTTQNQLMYTIQRELTSLCFEVDDDQLEAAKNQLRMNVLSSLDTSTQACEEIGRQMLNYGRRIHPEEQIARINAVDVNSVKAVANRYFWDRDPALAAVGPVYELPDYNWIRRHTFWHRY